MHLILWRHAEAEDTEPDLERRLTPRGLRQAQAVARWLHANLPERYAIVASPARRARQTAEALERDYRIERSLAPGADVAHYLGVSEWPTGPASAHGTLVLVGHQPTIGRLASLLLAGRELDWSVRKGAVWWLSSRDREDRRQVVLRTVINPDQL